MTCTATPGNGARIGMSRNIIAKAPGRIRRGPSAARSESARRRLEHPAEILPLRLSRLARAGIPQRLRRISGRCRNQIRDAHTITPGFPLFVQHGQHTVQNSSETRAGEGLKLLIVDDDPNHAEVVAESLERVGYKYVIATSGAAGLRAIEHDDPDVILTDLRMDGVDGLTSCARPSRNCPTPRWSSSPPTATCRPPSRP